MKKSKLSITLVTSFIAAMAMTGCGSSVKSSKDAIVTFTPYGSKEQVSLITNDVYNQYKKTSSGISKFYDKILEVLIRYEFKEKNFDKGEMKYAQIENWAKNQVQEQKDKAKANAKSNGTSYDSEWESILNSNNVENAKELKEKFIYEKEKEVIKNWYADDNDNAEGLKEEFIGITKSGASAEKDVKGAMPYHIRHILVKVDEASDAQEKFYKGTVSEDQAKRLYNTVTTLAEGKYNFAQVAKMYSEDGSSSSGGDVGIMTNAASSGSLGMVNEFQLGLYAYDNLYDARHTDPQLASAATVIKKGLGFESVVGTHYDDNNDLVEDKVTDKLGALVEVPYEAFVNMGKYAEVTADKYGKKLAEGTSTLYPRNILWNKYFNIHNVFVIKNAHSGASTFNAADTVDGNGNTIHHAGDEFVNLVQTGAGSEYSATLPRFNADGYLVDENNNVIIGVRSQYGIHLMVIEKSMYEFAEPDGTNKTSSSLATYYSTKIPGDTGYNPDSYVGYIESPNTEDYKKRADDVKSKITSFDSTYDYRLFTWLTTSTAQGGEGINITFTGAAEGLGDRLEQYIESQKDNNANKQEEGLASVWKTYTRLLEAQKADREAEPWTVINPTNGQSSPKLTRLASEAIAVDFYALYTGKDANNVDLDENALKGLYEEFAEGGSYYYYA